MYHNLKRKVMAKDVDLTSREWLDLVFEGKNKEYGAYVLRESSSDRHIKALAIVIIAGMAFIFLPRLVKSVVPHQPISVKETGGVVMSVITEPEETPAVVPIEIPAVSTPVQELAKTIKFVPPVIVPDGQVKPENLMPDQGDLGGDAAIGAITNPDGTAIGGARPEDVARPDFGVPPTEPTIIEVPEIPASFPGGEKELMKWLSGNLVYPVLAIEKGMEGQVIVRFVVGPDGSVGNVEILRRSVDPSLDKEAVRVVKKMPKWLPGKQNGKAVYAYYTLPVRFKLQN
jgi:protein TonB